MNKMYRFLMAILWLWFVYTLLQGVRTTSYELEANKLNERPKATNLETGEEFY